MVMSCFRCNYRRTIDLPYRPATSPDWICCHPEIAMEAEWIFAGKIINNDGTDPRWCPLNKGED